MITKHTQREKLYTSRGKSSCTVTHSMNTRTNKANKAIRLSAKMQDIEARLIGSIAYELSYNKTQISEAKRIQRAKDRNAKRRALRR